MSNTTASQATNSSLPWHARAYGALQSDTPVQQSFASAFIDEHVRSQLLSGRSTVTVQKGLNYTPDVDELCDDFMATVQEVELAPVASGLGTTRIKAQITASTYDTATLSPEATGAPTAQAPTFENTARVRCDLGVGATFAEVVGSDIPCSV